MEFNIKVRKDLFDKFSKDFDYTSLQKKDVLGQGGQGKVYSYCKQKYCTAVKKIYIEAGQSKYLTEPFSKRALLHGTFIELASMQFLNQLVLNNVCPNYILHYKWNFKKRTGICDDIYPHTVYFFNEYIDNSQTFTKWINEQRDSDLLYNAYFQIIYAIYTLQHRLNMTHLDLHSDNVIVKKVKAGGYWKYTINDTVYYVPNMGYIFYINDFGHAWIPNVLKSWFIRERYRPKNIKRNFDIMNLYRSTSTKYSNTFKKQLISIIKELKGDKPFPQIIQEIWGPKYKTKPTTKYTFLIEKYNINNKINNNQIPSELHVTF